jgi:hypothetical protein
VSLLGLAVAAMVIASCNVQWEAPSYGYTVWNYSSNQYLVVATDEDDNANLLVVGPYALIGSSSGRPFKRASVYGENCTTDLADSVFSPGDNEIGIVISSSGTIFVTTKGLDLPVPSRPPFQGTMPTLPPGCLHFEERGASQQP